MQLPNDDFKKEGRGGGGGGGGGGKGGGKVGRMEEEGVIVGHSPLPCPSPPPPPIQQLPQQTAVAGHECSACGKSIADRYLLRAVDRYWHEDCLRCSCCDCRLGEVGSTLFTKADLLLCRRDYLRLFGTTGYCSACEKLIPAFEMVMRARENVYHLECFACQQCNHRFCIGDKYYLLNNQILCEFDYEERLLYSGPHQPPHHHPHPPYGYDPTTASAPGAKHLHQLQALNQGLLTDDGSSGYGSPSPTSV